MQCCASPASHSHHTYTPRVCCKDRPFTSSAHTKAIILSLEEPIPDFLPSNNSASANSETLWKHAGWQKRRQPWTAGEWYQMQTSLYFRSCQFCIAALVTAAAQSIKKTWLRVQFFRLLLRTPPNRYIIYLYIHKIYCRNTEWQSSHNGISPKKYNLIVTGSASLLGTHLNIFQFHIKNKEK